MHEHPGASGCKGVGLGGVGSPCSRSRWSYHGSSSSVTNSSILPARSIDAAELPLLLLLRRRCELPVVPTARPEVTTNNSSPPPITQREETSAAGTSVHLLLLLFLLEASADMKHPASERPQREAGWRRLTASPRCLIRL